MEFEKNAVGALIKRYRKKKGLSQEVLSGLADMQRSHLADIERGEKLPTLPTLWKILLALDMKPHTFFQALENEYTYGTDNESEK